MLFGSAFAALRVNRNVVRWACLVPPNGLSAWTWGLSLLVDRMRGNAESMPVLYGWLEVQIPARLANATQFGIHWCKHGTGGKVAIFSILCAINLKKKRFTLQNKKLITVFWQKT
jgi:hypothetical protein